jgi:hypothetical protein
MTPIVLCDELATLSLPDATISPAETVAGQYRMLDSPLARLMSLPGMNVAGLSNDGPNPRLLPHRCHAHAK